MPPGHRISTNADDMDYGFVIRGMRSLPGGERGSNVQLLDALKNSLVFSAYEVIPKQRQVGFLRIVTDRALFSSITDLYVDPEVRGEGIGRHLIETAMEHDYVRQTLCILQCQPDVAGFYAKFGFAPVEAGSTIMFRLHDT